MSAKEEFIELFQEHIHRDGAEALLDYLTNKCDFVTAPASARYHGAYAGGLCEHSLNVYHCLATTWPASGSRTCMGWSTARSPSPWWPCCMTCARSAATSPPPAT